LGTYFGGNGSVECSSNSLALVGPQAKSSVVLTDTTITSALFNGSYRADREIMTQTGQLFKDGSGSSRLQIENGIGVIINNVYALPTTIGTAGDVLTRTGATSTTWSAPIALNPFNQSLNTSNNVKFNSVGTPSVDNAGTLTLGGTTATSVIIGNVATPTVINGSTTISGGALTANSGVKTNNIDSITGGSMTISGTTSSAVDIGRAGITTTLKGTTSINSLFTMPTTAGNTGDVITKNGVGGTIWSAPQLVGKASQTAVQVIANTTTELPLNGAGIGDWVFAPNYFTTGTSLTYNTGGIFRDNANNTVFRFRLRSGAVTMFDSGNLTLGNITALIAWNATFTFTYTIANTMVTNFSFRYNLGTTTRGFTAQQSVNTFNPVATNTIIPSVQWAVASVNNTITSNYGVLTKLY
jgi:hypothetical protein